MDFASKHSRFFLELYTRPVLTINKKQKTKTMRGYFQKKLWYHVSVKVKL